MYGKGDWKTDSMKRILLNWYYHRFDLTEYLLQFSEEFELVFIYKHVAAPEPEYLKDLKNIEIVYWGDFSSPYALLSRVKPDLVVFADLESFNQIALNIAARNRRIGTLVLQHGIRGEFEVMQALSIAHVNHERLAFSSTSRWSMRFLLSSLRVKNAPSLPSLLKFIYQRKTKDLTTALYQNQFELRRADRYIEFSVQNLTYHQKRDGVPKERFILTGNPAFDAYFNYLNNESSDKGYALLIDCPYTEAGFLQDHSIDAEKKRAYLEKLDRLSLANGLKTKVKLHPLSFDSPELYQSENLAYYRQHDLKELIAGANVVYFVHFSSVAPVILAYKPCLYFHYTLDQHTKEFQKLGLDSVPLFDYDERKLDIKIKAKRLSLEKLIPFLYSVDGKSSERVKHALLATI